MELLILLNIQISLGQPSPVKSNPSTPSKGVVSGRDGSLVVQEDFLKFYKETGLEPLAREVRIALN